MFESKVNIYTLQKSVQLREKCFDYLLEEFEK